MPSPAAVRRRLVVPVALVGMSLLAASLSTSAPAQAAAPPSTPAPAAASRVADALVSPTELRIASLVPVRVAKAAALGRYRTGLLTDPETGRVLWSSGASTPMRGASTTKLATAITTLTLQGTTTRFPTRVVTGGTARQVILVAGGDPLLTSRDLRGLAATTAASLATQIPPVPATPAPTPHAIRFAVSVDDSLFPTPTYADGWPRDYEPGVVTPVRPLVRDLRNGWDTSSEVTTYFAAQVSASLRTLLAGRTDVAVRVVYAGRARAAVGASEVARFEGHTTAQALAWMLLVSDNDVAEMLFRLNAIAGGRDASWGSASRVELTTLRALGVDVRGWKIRDGSGVSRKDRVTARGLVDILTVAASPRYPTLHLLRGWLPVAGMTGTLAARDQRFTTKPTSCARGKVFAKTGTLFDTIGLAGYAVGSDGRARTFAILVHSANARYSKLAVRHAVEIVPATATGCY